MPGMSFRDHANETRVGKAARNITGQAASHGARVGFAWELGNVVKGETQFMMYAVVSRYSAESTAAWNLRWLAGTGCQAVKLVPAVEAAAAAAKPSRFMRPASTWTFAGECIDCDSGLQQHEGHSKAFSVAAHLVLSWRLIVYPNHPAGQNNVVC